MDLRRAITETDAPLPAVELRCSAKACRRDATLAIRWNNPRLHTPERRKVWLACAEHETTLRDFLGIRGFYVDTVVVSDLIPTDG